MISHEDNETLTRVGKGTPMGELFRRFWLPAALSSELARPDCPPIRLRILGEDLVAFRDTSGRVGILEAFCPHRLAPLFFGRNEDNGLRCVYHGLKFNTDGQCVDAPGVSETAQCEAIKKRMAVPAYRTREAGGLIWVHMGSADNIPDFPRFEWTQLPEGHTHVSRWLQRSNWAQGMEGEVDTAHIDFMHHYFKIPPALAPGLMGMQNDRAPVITLRDTDYGFIYGGRRKYNDEYYWRVTQWMLPMWSAVSNLSTPFTSSGRAWVPIDDENTTTFNYRYRVDKPYTDEEISRFNEGQVFPPRMQRGVFDLPHGYRIDTFMPTANKENDFLLDRDMQKTINFSGLWGVNEQDRALQEWMPSASPASRGIADRTREKLLASDLPVVVARRRLIKMARDLAAGIEPDIARHGEKYALRAIAKICDVAEFDEFRARYGEEEKVPQTNQEGSHVHP